jgi:hypothetical protein
LLPDFVDVDVAVDVDDAKKIDVHVHVHVHVHEISALFVGIPKGPGGGQALRSAEKSFPIF